MDAPWTASAVGCDGIAVEKAYGPEANDPTGWRSPEVTASGPR
jgi:hypothetical protein